MNILMISSTFPYPPTRSGTEVRTFNLLKYLSANHSIALVTQRQPEVTQADIDALGQHVEYLKVFPYPEENPSTVRESFLDKGKRFLRSTVSATPPNVLYRYSSELQAWVDRAVVDGKYDAITCEHSVNSIYIRPEYRHKVRTLVNVHSSVYWSTRKEVQTGASTNALRDRLYLSTLYRYEKQYCGKFNRIVVTTPDDRQQLLQLSPQSDIAVIPNGVDLDLFPDRTTDPGGQTLAFVGAMDLSHNIDAARFFALEVLPAVQQQYPDAQFVILGNRPTEEIQRLGTRPGVTVTGRVPSMVEYLHRSTACVVPLQAGFGIKNKTLEAMAAGVPVVGSDRGLEGLVVDEPGQPLRALRANTVAEYVAAIGRVFEDASLRSQLAANARALIEAEFTWERAGQRYEKALVA
jgi:polysaccharide biosynthesis protein PslH